MPTFTLRLLRLIIRLRQLPRRVWLAAGIVVVLLLVLLWALPPRQSKLLRAVCRVEARACYVLPVADGDTLYLPLEAQGARVAGMKADSVQTRVDQTGVLVSNEGHVLTTDSLLLHMPDTLPVGHLQARLAAADSMLQTICRHMEAQKPELDYYARVHSVTDDGYNEVMAYRALLPARLQRTDSLRQLVQKARAAKSLQPAVLQYKARVRMVIPTDTAQALVYDLPARHVERDTAGMLLVRLRMGCLPHGANYLAPWRWGATTWRRRLLAFNDCGGPTASVLPVRVQPDTLALPAVEGGAYVNAFGRLCGLRMHGDRLSSAQIGRVMAHVHSWPVWWARNVWAVIRVWWADDSQPVVHPLPHAAPCRVLTYADGSRYEGLVALSDSTTQPLRQGWGRHFTADGAVYVGIWEADSLPQGIRTDSRSTYEGQFDAALRKQGMGWEAAANGDYYEGQWLANERHGHGFQLKLGRMVLCGAWKADRFLGERMVYTADRVYGIDISRYQHEIGRKRYGIDWTKLRITSLGPGKRVQGSVDYPVSFVYIKSTQGKKILNRYYAKDLRDARRHGLHTGTYHFFSTKVSGAEQAKWFLKNSSVAASDLPPVLDLEPTDAQVRQMGGDDVLFREALVWLREVERRTGRKPVLYVGQTFVNKHMPHAPAALRGYDVWIARYGQFKPYVHLLHWQLSCQGRVRGIQGDVDINVFNGTKEQFQEYVRRK